MEEYKRNWMSRWWKSMRKVDEYVVEEYKRKWMSRWWEGIRKVDEKYRKSKEKVDEQVVKE